MLIYTNKCAIGATCDETKIFPRYIVKIGETVIIIEIGHETVVWITIYHETKHVIDPGNHPRTKIAGRLVATASTIVTRGGHPNGGMRPVQGLPLEMVAIPATERVRIVLAAYS